MSRKIVQRAFGGTEVLELVDAPAPASSDLGPGDVLVAVAAAGVNPIDVMTRRGTMNDRPFEQIVPLGGPPRTTQQHDDPDPPPQDGGELRRDRHGGHRSAPVSQQPGTEHCGSMHGAPSSTASVTSTSAVSAAVRCGSAIS